LTGSTGGGAVIKAQLALRVRAQVA